MKFKIYLSIALVFIVCMATFCHEDEQDIYLVGIELMNFDNAGENMVESDEPVNKNAFVIGVQYKVCNTNDKEGKYPLYYSQSAYSHPETIANLQGNPTIICNDYFDEEHPAGSDVTKFFKFGTDKDVRQSLLLILTTPPASGTYSFKVIYNCSDNTVVEKSTNPVTLF